MITVLVLLVTLLLTQAKVPLAFYWASCGPVPPVHFAKHLWSRSSLNNSVALLGVEPQNKSAAAKVHNGPRLVSISVSFLGPLLQDFPSQSYQVLWVPSVPGLSCCSAHHAGKRRAFSTTECSKKKKLSVKKIKTVTRTIKSRGLDSPRRHQIEKVSAWVSVLQVNKPPNWGLIATNHAQYFLVLLLDPN